MKFPAAILFLIGFCAVQAQTVLSTQNKKAAKWYREAAAMMKRAQFPESIPRLQEAIDRDHNFIEAWQAMGLCYTRLGQIADAIRCYEKPIEINTDSDRVPRSYFALADLYFQQEDCSQSVKYARLYMERRRHDTKNIESLSKIIKSCSFVIKAIENALDYNIQLLPGQANYFDQQYFPVLTVDQQTLFYTGRNTDENIYVCIKQENGDWSRPVSISSNINTRLNEGACTISADGRTLILTACQGRRGYGSCDLYISYKVGNDWSVPENLGAEVNSAAWDVQPSLSADGRTIYFVSDRPGGIGGKDIWKASKDAKDEWSSAVNLGKPVNTASDEISPFIHVNGESLYFSSIGHPGIGGFDIFMSEWDGQKWSEPDNLGYPLNDQHEQVSLYISSDGRTGYYTIEKTINNLWTSRLHSFDVPEKHRVKRRSAFTIGHVRDAMTKHFLDADIKLYDLSSAELVSKVRSDAKTGEYTVVLTEGNEYGLYVERKGYLFADYSFKIDKIEDFNRGYLEIELQPIKVGTHIVLHNIYFGFDSFELKKESYSEIQTIYEFLRDNRQVVIEIQGYTDDQGAEGYNKALSENRAKAVYDALIKKKVPTRMLSYKGYGASNFIAPNNTETNRSKNRRIEVKVSSINH